MKKNIRYLLIGLLGLQLYTGGWQNGQGTVYARDDWKQEFALVCGQTQNAMELSPDELQNFIDRCNKLESRLHELNGPQGSEKKVYAKRLRMCKDLYAYTLDFKDKKNSAHDGE